MVTAKVKVVNPQGLHMRPAHVFVGGVKNFSSDVTIIFKGTSVNAKSIMQVMLAGITRRSKCAARARTSRRRSTRPSGSSNRASGSDRSRA